jgi:hypothetical protein
MLVCAGVYPVKRVNPIPFVLLLIVGVGNLVRFSQNVRAVEAVGLSGGGFAIGLAVFGLIMTLRSRGRP